MQTAKNLVIRSILDAIYFSGSHRLMRRLGRPFGICFVLHHVAPKSATGVGAQTELSTKNTVSADFLEAAIHVTRDRGYQIVSLDEAFERMSSEEHADPFACFTFDDGYRDNGDVAYPVFERARAPFGIFLIADYLRGRSFPWRAASSSLFAVTDDLAFDAGAVHHRFDLRSEEGRTAAQRVITDTLAASSPDERAALLDSISCRYGVDLLHAARTCTLDADAVRALAQTGLVTFGAHSVSHRNLRKLPDTEARHEFAESKVVIEELTGLEVRHFAYPGGRPSHVGEREYALCEEAGYQTGWTTSHGVLRRREPQRPSALPRISLNGYFQDVRHLQVYLSGASSVLSQAAALAGLSL
jgi:peptidoglycan/xylan/chitin deacetylase (PgdA/CDA1 family)